jgi:hypothetical protein
MSEETCLAAQLRDVYRERARLVAFLAACYPAEIVPADDEPGWWLVFASTPTGQMSWHIADDDLELFAHLPAATGVAWDGHSTEVKYERLAGLTAWLAAGGGTAATSAEYTRLATENRVRGEIIASAIALFGPPDQWGICRAVTTPATLEQWREALPADTQARINTALRAEQTGLESTPALDGDEDGYPDSERDMDLLACQCNSDGERDSQ